ncbi:hypothetical protein ACFOD4_04260 [Pseudoroseomonas globiformis]|uniref:Uncharacterized protein n=1 Tax=Teichococcus globiformis TaxID=2307229 RepID=A0ABV7FYL3_9PROT
METSGRIEAVIGQETHAARYEVAAGQVTVICEDDGSRDSVKLEGGEPREVAETLLREMLRRREPL